MASLGCAFHSVLEFLGVAPFLAMDHTKIKSIACLLPTSFNVCLYGCRINLSAPERKYDQIKMPYYQEPQHHLFHPKFLAPRAFWLTEHIQATSGNPAWAHPIKQALIFGHLGTGPAGPGQGVFQARRFLCCLLRSENLPAKLDLGFWVVFNSRKVNVSSRKAPFPKSVILSPPGKDNQPLNWNRSKERRKGKGGQWREEGFCFETAPQAFMKPGILWLQQPPFDNHRIIIRFQHTVRKELVS